MGDKSEEISSPILFAIIGRCPRCGSGRLFSGFLTVRAECDHCGLGLTGHDAADGPAVFIILIVGFIVGGLALWFELAVEPPTWVHMVLWPPVIAVLALGALRPFKGAFIGAQYKYRAVDREFPPEGDI
ncbi:MAG: DUF983 domain-containing protein [Rhodospirillales bacterium]|nr:hypothetical protein [Rhodospirillaceae bacterium]MDP6430053.1 DUF983 domain-containing protein [Rhodospirillales bacterium]MDP6642728.1 DUF983 domain-containing protein [Rhodospirillales bacterium]MDP6843253.1 DUF983 domain-containing protein [Rhodospirillales bacterium]